MKKTVITGGNVLRGEVEVHSAKNSILPILAAVILAKDECIINKCPPLKDVMIMLDILKNIGCVVDYNGDRVHIITRNISASGVPEDMIKKLRSSIFILGPMLARLKEARLGYPGGCNIGLRPIDLHLSGLRKLGAVIEEKEGKIICSAPKIKGNDVCLDYPSVGATENIMMASALAEGTTVILNAAKEPEIQDLQEFINRMGGRVQGAGTSRITVTGVRELSGCEFTPIQDRIVAGTFMILACITGGHVFIKNAVKEHNSHLIEKLKECGAKIRCDTDGIEIKTEARLKAARLIETMPYPGFPTDLQSPMMALQAVSDGTSIMVENVFENRFHLAGELRKMGADITVKDRMAVIKGIEKLSGAVVNAHDLRSGAALIVAGLSAEGVTTVNDQGYIDRGYYGLEEQIKKCGGSIAVTEE